MKRYNLEAVLCLIGQCALGQRKKNPRQTARGFFFACK